MGGTFAFAGFGAAKNKGVAVVVSATTRPRFSLGLRDLALGGCPIALGAFCMISFSCGIDSLSP